MNFFTIAKENNEQEPILDEMVEIFLKEDAFKLKAKLLMVEVAKWPVDKILDHT